MCRRFTMMQVLAIVLFACAALSVSGQLVSECLTAFPQGAELVCVQHGGMQRCSYLIQPQGFESMSEKVPVVVILHAYGVCADNAGSYTMLKSEALNRGYAVLLPQGVFNMSGVADPKPSWNAGGCCGSAMQENIDDVGFLAKLLDTVFSGNDKYDPDRLYATGHSNGCAMAQRLAVEQSHSRRLTAVGCASFYLLSPAVQYTSKVPLVEVHGVRDDVVPYKKSDSVEWNWPGALENLATWADLNECLDGPKSAIFNSLSRTSYGRCGENGDQEVSMLAFSTGLHELGGLFGTPFHSIVFDFFSDYKRDGAVVKRVGNKFPALDYSEPLPSWVLITVISVVVVAAIAGLAWRMKKQDASSSKNGSRRGSRRVSASAPLPVSDDRKAQLENLVKEFECSDKTTFEFPPGMTGQERKYVQMLVDPKGIKRETLGNGDAKFMRLSKGQA